MLLIEANICLLGNKVHFAFFVTLISNYCGQLSGLAEVQPGEHQKIGAVKTLWEKIPLADEMFDWGRTEKPWEIEVLIFNVFLSPDMAPPRESTSIIFLFL